MVAAVAVDLPAEVPHGALVDRRDGGRLDPPELSGEMDGGQLAARDPGAHGPLGHL